MTELSSLLFTNICSKLCSKFCKTLKSFFLWGRGWFGYCIFSSEEDCVGGYSSVTNVEGSKNGIFCNTDNGKGCNVL